MGIHIKLLEIFELIRNVLQAYMRFFCGYVSLLKMVFSNFIFCIIF